jgi:hypothetical protein
MKVFNRDGRLLAGSDYPASITRTTGSTQRNQLTRIVSDDGRHIWLDLNTMPLDRGHESWSVLTIAADVTDLVDALENARRQLEARAALLELAVELSGPLLPRMTVIERIGELLSAIVPRANAVIAEQNSRDTFHTTIASHGYGELLDDRRARFTQEHRQRWRAGAPTSTSPWKTQISTEQRWSPN